MAISQGLGRILERDEPVLSTLIDPFNVDAWVRRIAQEAGDEQAPEVLERINRDVDAAIAYNPIDARLFSMLGEIRQRQGDLEAAYTEFTKARSLSRTELLSVQNLIGWSLQRGQIGSAVVDIDTLLRRWPDRFDAVAPFFLQILGDQAGFDATLSSLAGGAPWRAALIRYLSAQPEGIAFAEQLLADLASTIRPPTQAELSTTINGRMRAGQYELAYHSFLFSLSPEERAHEGYVYNSGFAPIRLLRPFDWEYADKRGVELYPPSVENPNSGLVVRFLDTPVHDTGLGQTMLMPPGDYTLAVEVSGKTLSLPRQLLWNLYCRPGSVRLGELDIPEGSFQRRTLSLTFSIPDTGCETQRVQLVTRLVAESWRFRYQGELVVHSVRIEKVGS